MTHSPSNTELREAIYPYITGYVRLPDGRRLAPEEALDELEAIFQAHQQELLTEVLGELPMKQNPEVGFDDFVTQPFNEGYEKGLLS